MAHRHKVHKAAGGKAPSSGAAKYAEFDYGNKDVEKESKKGDEPGLYATTAKKGGGKVIGKAFGGRLDKARRAMGGSYGENRSPWSEAGHQLAKKAHGGSVHHAHHEHGGHVHHHDIDVHDGGHQSHHMAGGNVHHHHYAHGGRTHHAAAGGGDKWMQGAVKHPGALRTAAHRAGKSTQEFAREHAHSPGKVGKRSRLALTFSKFRPK